MNHGVTESTEKGDGRINKEPRKPGVLNGRMKKARWTTAASPDDH
jgi:hypothetical protein